MDLLTTFGPLLIIPAFLVLDFFVRARSYDTPRWWRTRALTVSLVAVAISFGAGLAWEQLLMFPSLLDLSGLGPWLGAGIGIVVYQFFHYWYHRAVHTFKPLWRWSHQMHHSVEGHDAWGAYFLSPLDVINFTSISILVAFPVLGLSPEAGVLMNVFLIFCAMFQHANMRTPRWLGYLVQRPESHSVHHGKGVHRYNYADLPLWDILFGTFRNPPRFVDVGFYRGASARIGEMLIGRDVSQPKPQAAKPEPARAHTDTQTLQPA